jgi:hypothetical protein
MKKATKKKIKEWLVKIVVVLVVIIMISMAFVSFL